MKRPQGFILWEGLSPLDGSPIVCITCSLCNDTKTDIFVEVHGTGASNFVAAV